MGATSLLIAHKIGVILIWYYTEKISPNFKFWITIFKFKFKFERSESTWLKLINI